MLPKGVAVVRRSGGRVDYYWYPGRNTPAAQWMRAQWRKLPGDPTSPEFWRAVQTAKEGRAPKDGGIACMIDAYRASPKWGTLALRTRQDYTRYLDAFRSTFGDAEPGDVDRPFVAELRDTFGSTPSKADHYVSVIRALFAWGIERGFARDNPAVGISSLSKDTAEPYAPWPQWAWELVPIMRRELRVACFLGLYTGQRLGDVLRMQLGHIEDGRVRVRQGKTGKIFPIRLHSELTQVVEECRKNGRIFLVSRQDGTRFSEDQFHAMWGREKKRPELKLFAQARPRLVFHGLRKSATCKLLEAGCTTKEVQSVTGMSLSMVEHYSRAVDQLKLTDSAMGKMERE